MRPAHGKDTEQQLIVQCFTLLCVEYEKDHYCRTRILLRHNYKLLNEKNKDRALKRQNFCSGKMSKKPD